MRLCCRNWPFKFHTTNLRFADPQNSNSRDAKHSVFSGVVVSTSLKANKTRVALPKYWK